MKSYAFQIKRVKKAYVYTVFTNLNQINSTKKILLKQYLTDDILQPTKKKLTKLRLCNLEKQTTKVSSLHCRYKQLIRTNSAKHFLIF